MVRPERRTKADVLAATAIGAVVVLVAALIWWTSDARATQSRPADTAVTAAPSARSVPAALTELWSAPSATTTRPVIAGGAVVTGDGRTVDGHDPVTGRTIWTFSRDRELCGVTWVYQYAVAVYPDVRGCGQVSSIDGSTGRRGPTRTGYADNRIRLSSDGTTVLAAGPTRLELWRSDLVRMIGFGEIDARVKPVNVGLGAGCRLTSAAASSSQVSVYQACPDSADLRLTLLTPSDQDDEPQIRDVPQPGVTPDSGARVLAVADTTTAVYVPTPRPHVSVIDATGTEIGNITLAEPPSSADPAGTVTRPGDYVTWWTGTEVLVFSADNLEYRYSVAADGPVLPLGPAAMMADRLLVPVTGGIGVYDPATGARQRVIAVDRPTVATAITPAVSGTTVLEQRGHTLVALGPEAG